MAARELRDGSALVRDVWGPEGRSLDARLADRSDAKEVLLVIEGAIELRAAATRRPDQRVARAVAMLNANGGELPIPAVAAEVGVSERQLERLFDEHVGYGPKAFARVARLRRATSAIERGSIASWARLAVDCGYADQSHLVREFRALTGVTPRLYARPGVLADVMSEIDNPGAGRLATVSV